MFGSKKIYAKVMNNKLVVRVGGGYMNMEEFINTYAESERLKLQHMDPNVIDALHQNNSNRQIIDAVPLSKRQAQGSPKAQGGSPRSANGFELKKKLAGSFVGNK